MAKGQFQVCELRHFGAFLLPAAVVEVAVAICLNSLIIQLPQDRLGTPTWRPFHRFETHNMAAVTSRENALLVDIG